MGVDKPLIDIETIAVMATKQETRYLTVSSDNEWRVSAHVDWLLLSAMIVDGDGRVVCHAASRTPEGLINGLRALLLSDVHVPYLVTVALVGERNPISK